MKNAVFHPESPALTQEFIFFFQNFLTSTSEVREIQMWPWKGRKGIKKLVVISSILGILLSAIGQYFGILNDFSLSGVSRFIGIVAGILMLLSLKSRSIEVQSFIVNGSTALGIIGAGILYIPAALINILIGFKLNEKVKEENTKEQLWINCFLDREYMRHHHMKSAVGLWFSFWYGHLLWILFSRMREG